MDSRLLGIILGVCGVGLLLISLLGNRWMRAEFEGSKVRVGLRDAEVCDDEGCVKGTLAECAKPAEEATSSDDPNDFMFTLIGAPKHCRVLIGGSMVAKMMRARRLSNSEEELKRRLETIPTMELGSFLTFARLTFIIGLVVAPLLLLCVILGAAKKFVHWPIQPTTLALFAVILIFITGPVTVALNPFTGLGVGIGFWLFGAGATSALISGIMLGRLHPPDDPFWDTEDLDGPQSDR